MRGYFQVAFTGKRGNLSASVSWDFSKREGAEGRRHKAKWHGCGVDTDAPAARRALAGVQGMRGF